MFIGHEKNCILLAIHKVPSTRLYVLKCLEVHEAFNQISMCLEISKFAVHPCLGNDLVGKVHIDAKRLLTYQYTMYLFIDGWVIWPEILSLISCPRLFLFVIETQEIIYLLLCVGSTK